MLVQPTIHYGFQQAALEDKTDKVQTRLTVKRSQNSENNGARKQLKAEEQAMKNRIVLTYPFDNKDGEGQINITAQDIERLPPGQFLNDNLIDFCLK